jgi:hypothetical protein
MDSKHSLSTSAANTFVNIDRIIGVERVTQRYVHSRANYLNVQIRARLMRLERVLLRPKYIYLHIIIYIYTHSGNDARTSKRGADGVTAQSP